MPTNSDGDSFTIRAFVDPNKLKDAINPLNYKRHTARQLEYVMNGIQSHGWLAQPLYCANTHRLLNGNGRVKQAIKEGKKSIPVDIGWWSEDDGNEILASLDPTGMMSSIDANALSSLSEQVMRKSKGKNNRRAEMAKDIFGFANDIREQRKQKVGISRSKRSIDAILKEGTETKPDRRRSNTDYEQPLYLKTLDSLRVFPSSGNDFGIPNLLPKKLFSKVTKLPDDTFARDGRILSPTWFYCNGSRPFDTNNSVKPEGGFLGFYCEDKYFEKYYRDPEKWSERLIDEQWTAIVEPDFSTYWDWPFALRLYSVYKARWCCRLWQELGIDIIPILRRTDDLERDLWMYSSLPEKTPIAFMQLRMGGKKNTADPEYWKGIGAVLHYMVENRGLKRVCFYADSSYEKYVLGKVPDGLKYQFVIPFINRRRPKKQEH